MQSENLFNSIHIELVGMVLVPFILFWLDTRRQSKKMHDETQAQNWEMHTENQQRLTEIETKLEPVWSWWNRVRGDNR